MFFIVQGISIKFRNYNILKDEKKCGKLQVSSLNIHPAWQTLKMSNLPFFLRLTLKCCHILSEGSGVQPCVFKKVLSGVCWIFRLGFFQMDSCINLPFFPFQKIFSTAESQHLNGNLALHLNCEKSSCFHTNVTESSHGLEGITSMDGTELKRIFLFWFWCTSLEYSSLVPKLKI